MSKVVYEGWLVRFGRRKIGRSFIHMRYFVLEDRLLSYYKKKPQDNVMVYVLTVYNTKDKYHNNITMAAFNIQEALSWKEKIEYVIDQHQESQDAFVDKYDSSEYKSEMTSGRKSSSSDYESQNERSGGGGFDVAKLDALRSCCRRDQKVSGLAEDEDDSRPNLTWGTTMGNAPPESVFDWTKELNSDLASQNSNIHAFSRKYWRLLQCQNGLRIFEELLEVDFLPKSCCRAMKAVGVIEASCEEIFELVMSMDATRFEWDCTFRCGSLVEEVDGHTAILYHGLQLDWFPMFVWPRDLCYLRYWRRNDDGSYVVLFRSRQHESCGPQPGFVRAHIESGGFNISPLKPRDGRPRTQVQHLMQIDLKGWGVNYLSSFQQHCMLQMLNGVAGLREYVAQNDERAAAPRIPVMVNMKSASVSSKRSGKPQDSSHRRTQSLDQLNAANRNAVMMDEDSDDEEDFQVADQEEEFSSSIDNDVKLTAHEEEPADQIDLSIFPGNLPRDDNDNARGCWTISDGNNFRVRGKNFCYDKSKTPAGKHLMDLVAVDWLKDTKRMDHVARRHSCAAQVASEKGLFCLVVNLQVPGSTHYSMVFYFVTKELIPGSLLQRFVDGDDEFRNSRLKLIPSVPRGSWIVRQSVGSSPCLLGKAIDCNYFREPKYLEIDVDIGSSTVANGVLGLVIGVITTLVVDMAFLVQGNTADELPERLIGAVRVCHLELSTAIAPDLDSDQPDSAK